VEGATESRDGGDGTSSTTPPPLLPVVTPAVDRSLDFLRKWLELNRPWTDKMIEKYGAIMIRGFDIRDAPDVESAVKAYRPASGLNNTYRGTSPRSVLKGTEYVFSAAEVPTNYPIAQHIEMSFLPEPPKQLYFSCLKPSESAGGETAVADFRRVYRDLPEDLKQKFLDKGIRYTRTNRKTGAYFTYDVADMVGWPEIYGTDDKQAVEAILKADGTPFEWRGDDGDTLVTTTQSHAFQLHPTTKEHVWFNHTQVFHWTTFPAELWFAFLRTREWKLLAQFLFVALFCIVKYGILGHKMALDATFGDGQPISIGEMSQIRKAIHQNMIFSRWQKGDLLAIDNFSTSHGRQPTFDKGRMVVVAWANPIRKSDEVISLEAVGVDIVTQENPQERTPESTLTNKDSRELLLRKQQHVYSEAELEGKLQTVGLEDLFSSSLDKGKINNDKEQHRRSVVSAAA